MRLRTVSITRLVREASNDRKALSEYERQSYTGILGAAKVKEIEEFVDCLNGREHAKESLGRQRCRYGAYCRNGDGKSCRFLHPERKATLRQALIKELDRYSEAKGYRKTRGGGADERSGSVSGSGDYAEGDGARACRSRSRDEESRREKSVEGRTDRSVDRRGSRSPVRRSSDRYGSSDAGSRKGVSFRSVAPVLRPK